MSIVSLPKAVAKNLGEFAGVSKYLMWEPYEKIGAYIIVENNTVQNNIIIYIFNI